MVCIFKYREAWCIPSDRNVRADWENVGLYGTGILFEEPNPTGSRSSDRIGLNKQQMRPHPRNTHQGGQGESTEAIEATRRSRGPPEVADNVQTPHPGRCSADVYYHVFNQNL